MNACISTLRLRSVRAVVHHNFQRFRGLYSAASLGLINYQHTCEQFKNCSPDINESFRKNLKKMCSDESYSSMVITDDLKKMVHIVENDDDIRLLELLFAKYNKQSTLRFSQFTFGPIVMRMYHHMNKPNEALCAYLNPEFDGLFDELTSHLILLDLLFRNNMYQEVIDVYEITREKQLGFGKHSKILMISVFGALYKLNTPESFKYAFDLLEEMQNVGHIPLRRVLCFGAALALKQNDPQTALDIISPIPNQGYILIRSIKMLAMCALNQLHEALVIFASVLMIDTPSKNNHTYPKDVVMVIEDHIKKSNHKDLIAEFYRTLERLKKLHHISEEEFEENLCSECTTYNPVNKMKTVVKASIDESSSDSKRYLKIMRPGLRDMY